MDQTPAGQTDARTPVGVRKYFDLVEEVNSLTSFNDDKTLIGRSQLYDEQPQGGIVAACREILHHLGEDQTREGLLRTPDRYAKALIELTRGYRENVEEVINNAIFSTDSQDLVIVRDIDIWSMCEHHMLPFTGKIHIGYIPNGRILALSKLARLAHLYARRLQIQERLTTEVASSITNILQPMGVAVVVECVHTCMVIRGVQSYNASTMTQSLTGVFASDEHRQGQFFSLLGLRHRTH